MSKAARNFSDARRSGVRRVPADPPAADAEDARPAVVFLPPLNPSRRMFLAGAALVAVWLGTLLTLYFTTIYPHRAAGRDGRPTPAATGGAGTDGPTAGVPATLPAGTVER